MTAQPAGLQRMLLHVFDAAVLICVLAVPLTMAGIREYGTALIVLCSFVMAVSWAALQILTPSNGSPIIASATIGLSAIGLVWFQLQPLPTDLLHQLSPFHAGFLPLWGSDHAPIPDQPHWQQISITPEATRAGLVLLVAYVVYFLMLTQRLRTEADADRLLRLIGLSAATVAAIGIGQVLVGDGRFLFLIEHPTRTAAFPAKGSFTNQNHFAHFMALGIGPLLWWWKQSQADDGAEPTRKTSGKHQHRSKRSGPPPARVTDKRLLLLIGVNIAAVILATAMSVSRGGIAVFGLTAIVALCATAKSRGTVLRLIVPVVVFLVAALSAFGTDELNERWDRLTAAHSINDMSHGRWELWTALSQAVTQFWPAGSGVGSHADVYPIWMAEQFNVRFSHAECGYLQILLETGAPGIGLLIGAVALCGFWCLQGWRRGDNSQKRRITVLAAAVLASLVHSVFDFVWYIPGCMIITLSIIACLCRSSQMTAPAATSQADSEAPTRFRLSPLVAAGLLLLILPAGRLLADSVRRDVTSAPHWKSFHAGMLQIAEGKADQTESLNEQLDTLIQHLERCIHENPFHHSAYSALAPLYLQRFEQRSAAGENQMTLQDVRDTIRQAEFADSQEMRDWLHRAFGDDVRDLYQAILTARQALRHRPLHSQTYLVLTETAFLTSRSPEFTEMVIDQAVLLRPHEPSVLYAAGLQADESGDPESAWNKWRHAAALNSKTARQIIRRYAEQMSSAELMDRLQPNRAVFCDLFSVYEDMNRPQDQSAIAAEFARTQAESLQNESSEDPADWKLWGRILIAAEYKEDALRCLRRSVRLKPQDLGVRLQFAELLAGQDKLREARRELTWLTARRPDDRRVATLLKDVRARLQETDPRYQRRPLPGRTSIRPAAHQVIVPPSTAPTGTALPDISKSEIPPWPARAASRSASPASVEAPPTHPPLHSADRHPLSNLSTDEGRR